MSICTSLLFHSSFTNTAGPRLTTTIRSQELVILRNGCYPKPIFWSLIEGYIIYYYIIKHKKNDE